MRIFLIGHKSPDLDSIATPVEYSELLKETKKYKDAEVIPTASEKPNEETTYIFKRFKVELPKLIDEFEIKESDSFILLDHNEKSQRSEKVVNAQIIEIVDHHKININFTSPINIDVRPFGSTSTIIYELYKSSGVNPTKQVKALILSSILSDTVGLKSPTTAEVDSSVANKLAESLKIDMDKFTFDIFKAKSDISKLSTEEIVAKDYKVFDFGRTRVFIGVVETVEPKKLLKKKGELIKALNETKTKLGTSQGYLAIQDIMNINSKVIYETEEEGKVLEKAFVAEAEDGIVDIGPKISRKKEIAPAIERVVIG